MQIIAIDSTCNHFSFSILHANGSIFNYESPDNWQHAESLLEKIQSYYHNFSSLDILSVVKGPGSFTGIRVGLSLAKGFKIVFPNLKIITPTIFQIMAHKASKGEVLVILDAKRGEFVSQIIGKDLIARESMSLILKEDLLCKASEKTIVTDSLEVYNKNPNVIYIEKTNSFDALMTTKLILDHSDNELEPIYYRKPDAVPQIII